VRDDVTDGAIVRRRAKTWRWVLSVVVAGVLLVGVVVLVIRLDTDRSARALAATVTAALLAAIAVAVTWFESRRITAHLSRTIDRLLDAESELRMLLDDLPEAVIAVDREGIVRGANAKVSELTDQPTSALVGRRFDAMVDTARRHELAAWLADGRRGEPVAPIAVRLIGFGGAVSSLLEAVVEQPRRTDGVAIVRLRDITEREARGQALEQARQRFQRAFHSAPIGMALVRMHDSTIIDANRSLAEMLGRPIAQLVGRSMRELTHADDLRAATLAGADADGSDSYLVEQRYLRSDGRFVWARTRIAVTEDNGVALAIMHIEDVTEQRRAAERLRWAASHDDLTGLPNRTELMARVDALLGDAAIGDVALLFIDLDNFKTVNDSLGHGIGDTLLTAMTARLRGVLGEDVLLARFGGDEFIVVLTGVASGDPRPIEVAELLRTALRQPVDVEGTEMFLTSSIGISLNDRDGVSATDLLRDADAAMYRAKARGRDCVETFLPGTHETTVMALRTATELRRGLERGEIVPYYQPIVELTTGHVTGFEALARWLHPERGLLAPDQFLVMAEETGLVDEIGEAILHDALAQFASWRARQLPFADATLSVNVGTRQVVDPDFAQLVAELLAQTGIPADSLWLEITETALLADVKASTIALRNLRSLGLHLAVDDFGTGYSSLTYLKRFPVEAIKIDRSFVSGLGLDAEDSTIVEAVVNLGHSFHIAVIAEGLETPLQLARLRSLGCDRGQGYLFGRPRPASIVEAERADA
jgi:diguanylate cyclase (GGDEF)-like protein/PAS domain S-box-containing protein